MLRGSGSGLLTADVLAEAAKRPSGATSAKLPICRKSDFG